MVAALLTVGVCATGLYWAIAAQMDAEGLEEVLTLPILGAVIIASVALLVGTALAERGSTRARAFLRVVLFSIAAGTALVAIWPPLDHAPQELMLAGVAATAGVLYSRPRAAWPENPDPPPGPE